MKFFLKHKKTILLAMADSAACVLSCLAVYFLIAFIAESDFGLKIVLNSRDVVLHSAILTVCIIVGLRLF